LFKFLVSKPGIDTLQQFIIQSFRLEFVAEIAQRPFSNVFGVELNEAKLLWIFQSIFINVQEYRVLNFANFISANSEKSLGLKEICLAVTYTAASDNLLEF